MQYAVGVVILLIVTAGYAAYRGRMRKPAQPETRTAGNVISMESHRKAKREAAEQVCSSCKKKNGKLIFYAQDNGTIVGLCKNCQDQAKKRDLLPL
ncbi:hypothetical protein [Paenibacillus tepidiphilus]|uniref:hypothetical protein n=1 Tax=Paenibacillus tepidiphilus TaxID=2608683 RepID=UPI0012398125|nr:hypothetical protein [Paenibacillus tepidiphilus]